MVLLSRELEKIKEGIRNLSDIECKTDESEIRRAELIKEMERLANEITAKRVKEGVSAAIRDIPMATFCASPNIAQWQFLNIGGY